jgi:hypothetical protein
MHLLGNLEAKKEKVENMENVRKAITVSAKIVRNTRHYKKYQ